jgi:hypothetical protein
MQRKGTRFPRCSLIKMEGKAHTARVLSMYLDDYGIYDLSLEMSSV